MIAGGETRSQISKPSDQIDLGLDTWPAAFRLYRSKIAFLAAKPIAAEFASRIALADLFQLEKYKVNFIRSHDGRFLLRCGRPLRHVQCIYAEGEYPSRRADRYEASREGKVRHTLVPLLLLTRSTWPPSCRAKESTNRPPSPESARCGSAPCPSSATVRRISPVKRFSVTAIVPFGSPGKAYLTAFVTSSLTMSPSGIARSTGRGSLAMSVLSAMEVPFSFCTDSIRSRHNASR